MVRNVLYKLNSQAGRMLLSGLLAISSSFLAAQVAGAAIQLGKPNGVTAPATTLSTNDITNLFCGIVNWVFWGLIVLAVVMALIGGYRYAVSSGDPEKVGTANKTLLYAAIAAAVAICAWGVPSLIGNILDANNLGNFCGSGTTSAPLQQPG